MDHPGATKMNGKRATRGSSYAGAGSRARRPSSVAASASGRMGGTIGDETLCQTGAFIRRRAPPYSKRSSCPSWRRTGSAGVCASRARTGRAAATGTRLWTIMTTTPTTRAFRRARNFRKQRPKRPQACPPRRLSRFPRQAR